MQEELIAELEQGGAGPSRPSHSAPADADKATERVKADVSSCCHCSRLACGRLTLQLDFMLGMSFLYLLCAAS